MGLPRSRSRGLGADEQRTGSTPHVATADMKPVPALTIYLPLIALIIEAIMRWLKLLPPGP